MSGAIKSDRRIRVATVALGLLLATCPAPAATFTPVDVAGLVAAINTANANGQIDTIDLGGQTFTLTAVDNVVGGENGLPVILGDGGNALTIRNGTIERAAAASRFRFLHVPAGVTLVLENATLRNGYPLHSLGGAIYNLGNLSTSRSTFSGSTAGFGSGIYNGGSLSVNDSTFSEHGNTGAGGAIYNAGALSVVSSTFRANFGAIVGGAIANSDAGTVTIRNSTFSGNVSSGGSAIYNSSVITAITNSTIAYNETSLGPGGDGRAILNDTSASILELSSCIIAANTAEVPGDMANVGTIGSAFNNLVGVGDGSGLTHGVNGNLVGSATSPIDPILGMLQNNGGPTFTHALYFGTPAVDAGSNPAALAFDQRGAGFVRVAGAGPDIGAYELQASDLSATILDSPDPVVPTGTLSWTVIVGNLGPDAAANVVLSDPLPAGTTFVSVSAPAGWSCSTPAVGTNGTVSCSIASLAVESAAFTIVAVVDGATPFGTVLSNTANVASVTPEPNSANNNATATTTVASPAVVSATKTVAGIFAPSGLVAYTIVLSNAGPGAQLDNPGDELIDVLPAELALVSATATSGTALATTGTNTVTWNGSIPAGGTVAVTVRATVRSTTPLGARVSNQATIAYDLDGNGTNEAAGVSDDPATTTSGDPTTFVAVDDVATIPVLSGLALGLFALFVALAGALAAARDLS